MFLASSLPRCQPLLGRCCRHSDSPLKMARHYLNGYLDGFALQRARTPLEVSLLFRSRQRRIPFGPNLIPDKNPPPSLLPLLSSPSPASHLVAGKNGFGLFARFVIRCFGIEWCVDFGRLARLSRWRIGRILNIRPAYARHC